MHKIKLNDNCKKILLMLKEETFDNHTELNDDDVIYLSTLGLISITRTFSGIVVHGLTEEGNAYIYSNPKLDNPSIWDDKKYWINTAISVIALIVAIIALFKK